MIFRNFACTVRPTRRNMGVIPAGSSHLRRNRVRINGTARPTTTCGTAAFDAQDWFNDYFGTPEPALRQNDFGGTFGGPVEIPGLYNGKDKTFFFVSYEGLRLTAPQAATVNYVPDLAREGVLPPGAAAPVALQPGSECLSRASPNGLDDAANGIAEYIGSWSNPASLNSTSVRFDHVVNDKLRLFFRFSDTGSSSATSSERSYRLQQWINAQLTLCGPTRLVPAAFSRTASVTSSASITVRTRQQYVCHRRVWRKHTCKSGTAFGSELRIGAGLVYLVYGGYDLRS